MDATLALAGIAVIAWAYLLTGRGSFWRALERDDRDTPANRAVFKEHPSVAAIVPARDEADAIVDSLSSLLSQDYRGSFKVVVVDDQSSDDTAVRARSVGDESQLVVVRNISKPEGWTGKLWAQQQGIASLAAADPPDYFWFTDADIVYTPDTLETLVARAQRGHVLVSLMAKLHCEGFAEKMFLPAFIYFFSMLYPFSWVNGTGGTAAAAGGCILLRRSAFEAAGGLVSIKSQLIDDCALARQMKRQGPIWIGLTDRAKSIRPYGSIADIGPMISRSAYVQLNYSVLQLATAVTAMILVFLTAPFLVALASGAAQWLAVIAWTLMAVSFQPMLRFYRASPLWGLAFPVIAAVYTVFTLQSAVQFWLGRGGMWKGRSQAIAPS